jgi:trk system potassium uptake protein TrkA
VIVVGSGRLGAELALFLSKKNQKVTIIDVNPRAFEMLGPDFKGRTVQGEAVDLDVLKRAGIEEAHGFAAVTSTDSVNIVTARAARDLFHVEHVIARIYHPHKAMIYEKLGIQTIATSTWGALRFAQFLLHPSLRVVGSAGNGDVQIYEFTVPAQCGGKALATIVPTEQAMATAVTRGGKTILANPSTILEEQDIVQVAATSEGATLLRGKLNGGQPK